VCLIIVRHKEADGQWRVAQELLHADPAAANSRTRPIAVIGAGDETMTALRFRADGR